MTTLEDVEALAQRLSAAERIVLAKRWLAENSVEPLGNGDQPGVNGEAADDLADLDARIAKIGTVVSGRRKGEVPLEEDPLWGLGSSPFDLGVTDASVNHDRYAYGYRRGQE